MTATPLPNDAPRSLSQQSTTTPSPSRWNRPGLWLSAIAILVLLIALISPEQNSPFTDTVPLTTRSTEAFGARGIYQILERLGWRTEQKTSPFTKALDTNAVYVILQPPIPFDEAEDSALIHMVRAGGRVIVASQDSAWTAMFRMSTIYPRNFSSDDDSLFVTGDVPEAQRPSLKRPGVFSQFPLPTVREFPPIDDTPAVFMWHVSSRDDSVIPTPLPLMLGRRVDRGHVVLLSAPFLLANDVVRDGRPALAMQRALEWLAPPNRRVIFDEYHQTPPEQRSGMTDAIFSVLTDTPGGHVTLQLLAAALILLLAVGIRAILPTPVPIIQRRSSLEHVDALARAYAYIHATRLGAQRLIRGLRRRHPLGIRGSGRSADEAYLAAIRARYNIVPSDIQALTAALGHNVSDETFLHAGQAVAHIEQTIKTS